MQKIKNSTLKIYNKFSLRYLSIAIFSLVLFFILQFYLSSISPQNKAFAAPGIYGTINFQGKIVNKTGGTNLITGSPACIKSGASDDTCDFRLQVYDGPNPGTATLLWQETYNQYELGTRDGIFSFELGWCNGTSVDWTGCEAGTGVNFANDNLYVVARFNDEDDDTFDGSDDYFVKRMNSVPYSQNAGMWEGIDLDAIDPTIRAKATNSNIELSAAGSGNLKLNFNTNTGQVQFYNTNNYITSAGALALAGSITLGTDVNISRGAANRLDLASGDSLNVVSGDLTITSPATTGSATSITANALTTGTALLVPHTTSVIANGGSLARLSSTSVDTSTTTGVLLDLSSTASAAGTQFLQTYSGLTTGIGQSIALSNASQTSATALKIAQTATTTGYTGTLVDLSSSSTTGAATFLKITANSSTVGTGQSISMTSLTTGTGLSITAGGTGLTGNALFVTSPSTSAFTNGGVRFSFTGAHTGNGFQVDDATATGTAASVIANSLSTGTALNVSSTSTAGGASGVSYLLNLARSGANSNLAHTAYGLYSTVTNTNVTSGTNIAAYLSASGATTANYGLIVGNGSVGIGTATPGSPLEIYKTISQGTIANLLSLNAYIAPAANTGSSINFLGSSNSIEMGKIASSWDNGGNGDAHLRFYTRSGGLVDERVRIDSAGKVGIGDTTPDHLLDVAGNIGLNASSYINFGDTDGTTGYGFYDNAGTLQYKNSSGSWTNIGVASSILWNLIGSPGNNQSLTMGAWTTTWTWDSLTTGTGLTASSTSLSSGSLFSLASTSTAATGNTQKILNISTSGANANATQTTYGLYATNTHTGTTSTNVGAYFSASGGTNNYAAIFDGGNVGIGTDVYTGFGKLRVASSGDYQLRLAFDTTYYSYLSTDSAGQLEFRPYGNTVEVLDSRGFGAGYGGKINLSGKYNSFGNEIAFGSIWAEKSDSGNGTQSGKLNLGASVSGTINPSLTISDNSFVGIHTQSPTANLDIAPTINSSGNFNRTFLQISPSVTLSSQPWEPVNLYGVKTVGSLNVTGGANINAYQNYIGLTNTGGAIANYYGQYIASPSGTITNKYALVTEANAGNVGIGTTSPTAVLHLKAGTASANTAPLKFTSGTNLTTPEAGAMEWDGTNLYMTQTSGPTRKTIAYTDSAMTGTFDGVNLSTGTQGGLAYYSSTSQLSSSGAGTAGQALISGGTGSPTWFAPTAGSIIFAGTSGILAQDNSNFFFDNTNKRLGIGTATPGYKLSVAGTDNNYLSYIYNSGTGAIAGGLSIRTDGTGNLLNLNYGGSDLVTINSAQATFNLPTSFNASGDVSLAYDLNFTNQSASYIKTLAPFTIEVGENFESNNLTLRTFNSGSLVFDSPGGVALSQAQAWSLATSTSALNISSGLLNLDTTNGRIGIGDVTPDHTLDVAGNIGLSSGGYINFGDTDGTSGYGFFDNSGTLQYKNSGGAWTNFGSASSVPWNGILSPTANQSLTMGAWTSDWTWNSLTTGTGLTASSSSLSSGSLFSLASTSTAATGNTQKILNISTSGANANSTQTTYGLYATNTHTGTASTNVGAYFSASGGTNNYAAIFDAGNVGIGTTSPTSKLTVQGTNSTASLGSELLTTTADRDFSGAGNWSGTGWSVGSGVATHTAGANNFVHTYTPTAGRTYQIKATISTTTAGTLRPLLGNQGYPDVGKNVETLTQHTWVITTVNTDSLRFVPNATWEGSIDDVSVQEITTTLPVANLLNSDGSTGIELRSGGSGLNNYFFGIRSGKSNISGIKNLAIGTDALLSNTIGNGNVALGLGTLAFNTTGNQNTAIGTDALNENSTGSYNTAIGSASQPWNTTGSNNTSVGYASLWANTTGNYNVAVGRALSLNTTGLSNTAVGYAALYSNITGSENVAFGRNAGRYQADGTTALTTPSNSVYIGSLSRGLNNSDSNSIVIGYNAIGLGANTVVLGNDSITTTALKGNVGIGTVSPTQKLEVAGSLMLGGAESILFSGTSNKIINASGVSLGFQTSNQWNLFLHQGGNVGIGGTTADSTPTLFVSNGGNVGIGTTAPGYLLQLGSGSYASNIELNIMTDAGVAGRTRKIFLGRSGRAGGELRFDEDTRATQGFIFNTTNAAYPMSFKINDTSAMFISTAGNVGIGTTSPTAQLALEKVFNSGNGSVTSETISHTRQLQSDLETGNSKGLDVGVSLDDQSGNNRRLNASLTAIRGSVYLNNTSRGYGNIIGIESMLTNYSSQITSNDSYLFKGTFLNSDKYTNIYGLYLPDLSGVVGNSYGVYSVNGTNYFGGNVGIGVTGPSQKLEVTGGNIYITDTNGKLYLDTGSNYISYDGSNLQLISGTGINLGATTGVTLNLGSSASDDFNVDNGKLVVEGDTGNVGIGTASPNSTLDVNGATTVRLPTVGNDSYLTLTSATANTFNTRFGTTALNQYAWFTNIRYTGSSWARDNASYNAWRMNQVVSSTDHFNLTHWSTSDVETSPMRINGNGDFGFGPITSYVNMTGATLVGLSGNVGIGTINPSSILHTVASGAKTTDYIGNLLTNTATSSTASITKTGLSVESTGTWNGTTAVNRGLYVNATGGTANYAAIFENGDVGIGTTSPVESLTVQGQSIFGNRNAAWVGAWDNTVAIRELTTSTSDFYNLNMSLEVNSATPSTYYYGLYNYINTAGSSNYTNIQAERPSARHTSTGTLTTLESLAASTRKNNGSGTITTASGVYADVINYGGTITNAYGINIGSVGSGGGTNTTAYGLYIGEVTGTTDYGIYQVGSSDDNYFAGNVGIGATAPGAMLQIGTAGSSLGTLRLTGNTSGYVQLQTAAAAGSWTMTLPSGTGSNGQQLTTNGSGVTSWTAAGSTRDIKNIIGLADANTALSRLLETNIYKFNYKPGMGTGDSTTEYVGVMADESAWAMHYNGSIVNPVNTLGYAVLGIQALNTKINTVSNNVANIDPTVNEVNNITNEITQVIDISNMNGLVTLTGNTNFDLATNSVDFSINTNSLFVSKLGNVGINTDSPDKRFEILDSTDAQIRLTQLDSVNYADIKVDNLGNLSIFTTGANIYFGNSNINTNGSVIARGDLQLINGKIIDKNANVIISFTPEGKIDFFADFSGDARRPRTISLNPEYSGTIKTSFYGVDRDTEVDGDLVTDIDTTEGSQFKTYYEWKSNQTELQYQSLAVRIALPNDFDDWQEEDAITIDLKTKTQDIENNQLMLYLFNPEKSTEFSVIEINELVSQNSNDWLAVSVKKSDLVKLVNDEENISWNEAGTTGMIYLRMATNKDGFVQLGEVKLNYLSKW